MDYPGVSLKKIGGCYQLDLDCPEKLKALLDLDEALWAAMSIPNELLTCDQAFLRFLDTDENARVRTDELRQGITWLFRMLKDFSGVASGSDRLMLSAIDDGNEEGAAVKRAAELILSNLNADDRTAVTLEQVRNRQSILGSGAANGDGVIPPEAVKGDTLLEPFIRDIMSTIGSVGDASGLSGVTDEQMNKFTAEAKAYLEWYDRGLIPEGETKTNVMPLGADTPSAYEHYKKVADKIDQYFSLSSMVRLDERLVDKLRLMEQGITEADLADTAAIEGRMRKIAVAMPRADEILHIDENINPVFREDIASFAENVLPHFSKSDVYDELRLHTWRKIKASFAPYTAWLETKGGVAVENLGQEKLKNYIQGDLPGCLQKIMDEDKAVARELEQIQNVEKLILCQRWMMELVNNFVSFPVLYDPERRSLVELGTLILDGRRFTLNVLVRDRKAHKEIAKECQICLLYLEVVSSDKAKKDKLPATFENGLPDRFEIATAVTAGSMRNLFRGKKGLFVTSEGRELDATVVDIIENPVSLWEAVKQPFKKLGEFVGKQAEKFSTSRYASMEKSIDKTVSEVDKNITTVPAKAGKKNDSQAGALRDLLMGGSVALAAVGGTFTYIVKTIKEGGVGFGDVLMVLGGIIALIAMPTLIVAWAKLRRRNLAVLFEACGMTMNVDMMLTTRIGNLFTRHPSAIENKGCKVFGLNFSCPFEDMPDSLARRLRWIGVCFGVLALVAGVAVWKKHYGNNIVKPKSTSTECAGGVCPIDKSGPAFHGNENVTPAPSIKIEKTAPAVIEKTAVDAGEGKSGENKTSAQEPAPVAAVAEGAVELPKKPAPEPTIKIEPAKEPAVDKTEVIGPPLPHVKVEDAINDATKDTEAVSVEDGLNSVAPEKDEEKKNPVGPPLPPRKTDEEESRQEGGLIGPPLPPVK
ncbi:MAG: hypothetical protein JXR97_14060 [Planctomycetes bacterium]|nr:hypothetical protein [Planctomycetota bacterium]